MRKANSFARAHKPAALISPAGKSFLKLIMGKPKGQRRK